MRRLTVLLSALVLASGLAYAADASAQSRQDPTRERERAEREQRESRERQRAWNPIQRPLNVRQNAGPCPYVKVLYDAARYVEFEGGREASAAVGYTGEIDGLAAACRYQDEDPIEVDINVLFHLGKGPTAREDGHTYRYWVAVTERNSAVLHKEYFDLPVQFGGSDRVAVTEEIRGLVIPRAEGISGANFEILIGFEVTPQMAAFNRDGKRFRIDAGAAGQQ